ncbi:hypothetical protein GCM10022261_04470 [Brevibacterium daeguense]|uniref:DUF2975 domain-containing protein n=2 Tax=Brevibacterium daeguense TaxID=909936 RepID=A0ABP8EGD6_9MICO
MVWAILPVGFLVLNSVAEVIRIFVSQRVSVSFDADLRDGVEAQFAGVETLPITGLFTTEVALSELAPVTVAFLLASLIVWIAGLGLAGLFMTGVVRCIAAGEPFAQPAFTALRRLLITLVATLLGVMIFKVLGTNLVLRDLALADLSVTNGVTPQMVFTGLGILCGLELLRQTLHRGRRAEQELDGLV